MRFVFVESVICGCVEEDEDDRSDGAALSDKISPAEVVLKFLMECNNFRNEEGMRVVCFSKI